ncbi:MAG: TonB-dependent receptor [Acidobacteria bacterium]|nr:TonB-dependent receptor [Acidobacteriota bacterium]MBI3426215.1 TonB-dependent receptor [Acidobacteriota bacterium]
MLAQTQPEQPPASARRDLRGQILDATQAGIPGARLILQSEGARNHETTTDAQGAFEFTKLATGTYHLLVSAAGFANYEQYLSVRSTDTERLNITLAVAAVKSTVDVTSERKSLSLAAHENADAVILRGELLRRLPHDPDQLLAVLQRMAGSLNGPLRISVNGVSDARMPPISTIKEIRINSDPFAALYHEPGSARVEIETKGGDEQVHAGGSFDFRHSVLDARNAFSLEKPPLKHEDYGGWWSSRLFNKRSFIFGSFDRRQHHEASLVSAYTPDGYYYDAVPAFSQYNFLNVRADFVPNERQTFGVFYDLNRGGEQGLGIGSFDLPERAYNLNARGQSWQAAWRAILSPTVINETQFRYAREHALTTTDNYNPAEEIAGAFNQGGSQCCDARNQNQRASLLENLTLSAGHHFIKTGGSLTGVRVADDSEQNFGGTFLYSGLSFYRLHRPILYTLNVGDPQLRFNLWNFAAYAQDDWRVAPRFTLSPGLRYETQTHLGDRNNLAPRLGFAWSPFKRDSTVVRGGAGLFYQQLAEAQLAQALRFDGVRQRQYIILRPRYPNPFGNLSLSDFPVSLMPLAADLRTPYQWHTALGIEQRLPKDATLTLTYNYERGLHLFRARDINAPLADHLRPRPALGRITQLESSASATTHRLSASYWQSLNEHVTLIANYTWARTLDDADGPDALPMDNYQLKLERGYAAHDIRHQVFLSALLSLPLGLEATPMFYFNTGRPYNITTGLDDNNDMIVNDRPAGVARNAGRGAAFNNVNLRLSREFTFGPQQTEGRPFGIECALDATNLLNHVNLADFNGVQTSPFFGRANAAYDARQLRVQINFNFH